VISGSAARNAGRGLSEALTVSCTPGLASTWLCPRIERFREICPDVALSVVTPRRLDDVSNPDVDLFLTFGTGNLPEMEVEPLKAVEFTPLCSPVLLNRLGGLVEPKDVLRAGLLHLHDRDDWRKWFRLAGLDEGGAEQGMLFANMNLVYAAAMHSQGIAMGDEFICHGAMEAGALVRPFDLAIRSPRACFLVVPPEKTGNPAVSTFRSWLVEELPAEKA
jgi:LysR family glycine cleavage system transcriptional activator